MARYKSQRKFAGTLLYILTAVWGALWGLGWFMGEQDLAMPAFFAFWTFVAVSLGFMGLRGAIEE